MAKTNNRSNGRTSAKAGSRAGDKASSNYNSNRRPQPMTPAAGYTQSRRRREYGGDWCW